MIFVVQWIAALLLAALAGRLITLLKMPSILGWLIAGMLLGPHALSLMSQSALESDWYKIIIVWMQCAFGLILGTELIWKRLKSYGRGLIVTTLTQSLGTFALVTLVFGIIFAFSGVPVFLAVFFGAIALATAPAPALSIVNEFHAKGPVTDTLLPMAVLDDVVGILVFFTVNASIAGAVSNRAISFAVIPLMIFVPILIGIATGLPVGYLFKKGGGKGKTMIILLLGITVTAMLGLLLNQYIFTDFTLNYMLMCVSFSAVFTNMVDEQQLEKIVEPFQPILSVSLLAAIVDLGAPLNYHLILGAGLYTFLYIAARAAGKYFGARLGAKAMHMPLTVQKYLGLTLLPHSGVSLVFTGIACATLASMPDLVGIVQGTIAAAAVINEIIAVFIAKKGFELAKEI
ncbi:MAG: cation:proton antiporter [Peptoniphilaceae bacterium]|nr:cation:proton antiporter [Peptoniphilaceae bacterium]MDY5765443.1 cation:proton antiporter [Peptoniphilaceae bacterium]